jgi:NAD(P)-dependent dehydrogenase (short-subunit alcohol dehydrogenase family)
MSSTLRPFAGHLALVTCSTSGIGLGIAEVRAAAGANIVLNGFGDAGEIEATRAELGARNGVKVLYDGADMSRPEAIEAMVRGATEPPPGPCHRRVGATPAAPPSQRDTADAREVIEQAPWQHEAGEMHEGVHVHDHLSSCSTV